MEPELLLKTMDANRSGYKWGHYSVLRVSGSQEDSTARFETSGRNAAGRETQDFGTTDSASRAVESQRGAPRRADWRCCDGPQNVWSSSQRHGRCRARRGPAEWRRTPHAILRIPSLQIDPGRPATANEPVRQPAPDPAAGKT